MKKTILKIRMKINQIEQDNSEIKKIKVVLILIMNLSQQINEQLLDTNSEKAKFRKVFSKIK